MTDVVNVLGYIALVIICLIFWAFVLLFHVLADWRATEMGRNVMSFMSVCAIILTYSLLAGLFRPSPELRPYIRLIVCAPLGVVVWRHLLILIRVQRQARARNIAELWENKPK